MSAARQPRIADIIRAVASVYGVDTRDLTGRGRHRSLSLPRHIALYLAVELTDRSYSDIARFAGRDHSTVMYAHEKIAGMRQRDQSFAQMIDLCQQRLTDPGNDPAVGRQVDLMVRQVVGDLRASLRRQASENPIQLLSDLTAVAAGRSPCG